MLFRLHLNCCQTVVNNILSCYRYMKFTACGRGTFQCPKHVRCVYTVRYVYCMWTWHIPTSETRMLCVHVCYVYCMWMWHIPTSETHTLCVHSTLCLLHVGVAHSNVRNLYVLCTRYVMFTACGRGTFQRLKPVRCVHTKQSHMGIAGSINPFAAIVEYSRHVFTYASAP